MERLVDGDRELTAEEWATVERAVPNWYSFAAIRETAALLGLPVPSYDECRARREAQRLDT